MSSNEDEDNDEVGKKVKGVLTRYQPKTPEVKCPSGNVSTMICFNPDCKQKALRCGDEECIHCGDEKHESCRSAALEEITAIVRSKTQKSRKALRMLVEMEMGLVEVIQ